MNYSFNTKNGVIKTFISFESYNDRVSIWDEAVKDWVDTTFYNNINGDLCFKYRGEEIKFSSFHKTSMKEIKEQIKSGKSINDDDLMLAIICDGMENVRIAMEMPVPDMVFPGTSIGICSGKKVKCTCKLQEEFNSMPHENYKLRIVADNDSDGYGITCSERMYTSSITGFMEVGIIEILDSIDDGKTAEEHVIDYFNKFSSKDSFEYKMKVEV